MFARRGNSTPNFWHLPCGGLNMNGKWISALLLGAAFCIGAPSDLLAQDAGQPGMKQDLGNAGRDTKNAGQDAGRGIDRGARASGRHIRRGTRATGRGLDRGAKTTGRDARRSGRDVARGANRGAHATGRGIDRGAHATGRGIDRGAHSLDGSNAASPHP